MIRCEMKAGLVITLIIGFSAVVQASDNSIEVTLEDSPESTQRTFHWKFVTREVNSDSNYAQWRYKSLAGSDMRLSTRRDTRAIKQLVPGTVSPTIRWISRSIVVVVSACRFETNASTRVSSLPVRCLYVFEKAGSIWKLTHHYRCGRWYG